MISKRPPESPNAPLRVLFLGMGNRFAYRPLHRLIEAGVNICAVVVPGTEEPASGDAPIARLRPQRPSSPLTILNPFLEPNILHLAWEHDIPAWALHQPAAPAALALLRDLNPGAGCVACFSLRLPPALLNLPRHGFLNLHPSLLPAYRGPAPLFWSFQRGETETGVTVHFMDEGLDSGDIALQAPVPFPDGISGAEADQLCSEVGAELLLTALRQLAQGRLAQRPQPAGGSYHPWPEEADFRLDTAWPARRAFNFMRGTVEWGLPYPVDVAGVELALATAVTYRPDGRLGQPLIRGGQTVWLQFAPGILEAELAG